MPVTTVPASLTGPTTPVEESSAFARLWRGFMTARAMIALVLLLMTASLYALGPATHGALVLACVAYLVSAVAVRALASPRSPGQTFDPQWVFTIGIDIMMFTLLQYLQVGGINYTPLLALPVLLAAVMGSALLAQATAAGVTLLLLADAWLYSLQAQGDAARFLQSGLTGIGFFALAFLANQLSARLAREELEARRSQQAARVQVQVNELVIETLADGVLVVDPMGVVRVANPAAHHLLGDGGTAQLTPFALEARTAWRPLVDLARQTFRQHTAQVADIAIQDGAQGARRIHVSARLTSTHDSQGESLCVMFLQDLREMEARLRTEKLAAMGRMSAAVAHEIRNPLAAIMQANALLDEDLADPAQKRLTLMVRQNSQRLAQIVEEILNISRVQQQGATPMPVQLTLDDVVLRACGDWGLQAGANDKLHLQLQCRSQLVAFEPDHLRRVLVNLLDNALRYCGGQPDSICVSTLMQDTGLARLQVWSDGQPLEQSVQRHLFEPFFSSESRSSGLGLYICRELCERHGAVIAYERTRRYAPSGPRDGNEFSVVFRPLAEAVAGAASFDTITT